MQRLRIFSRPLLILVTLLSLILCPLTSGKLIPSNNVLAGDLRQIDFTPNISPLALTQTAESIGIDPNLRTTPAPNPTFGPGQYFEENDPYRPQLNQYMIEGNWKYGYSQLVDNPDLYAVWITDEEGTHYLIVDKDSEVLTGGTNPQIGFFQLVAQRDLLEDQIETTVNQETKHRETANHFRLGALTFSLGWGACAILTGGLCLPLIGVAGGVYWLSKNKDNDAEIQQTLIESYQRQLEDTEKSMVGKFIIGQSIYGQP